MTYDFERKITLKKPRNLQKNWNRRYRITRSENRSGLTEQKIKKPEIAGKKKKN